MQKMVSKVFSLMAILALISGLSITTATAAPSPKIPFRIIASPVINEFSASTTGTDVEYMEIFGAPGIDYSTYKVLEIEGDSGTTLGMVDEVISLGTTNSSGIFLVNLASNALENGSLTILLVQNFTGALNNDLDTNNDGIFDSTPWDAIVDAVAVNDGGLTDKAYGVPVLGVAYDGLSFAPGGASRIPDGTDTNTTADWVRNDFDLAGIPGSAGTIILGEAYNTPGVANRIYVPVINEFSASTVGTDVEFIEIFSSPSANMSAYTVLEIEGDSGTSLGMVDEVISLGTADASGFYLVNLSGTSLENNSLTLLLVRNFTGALNDDLDTNDDGIFDSTPWGAVVDAVAVNDGGATDKAYGVPVLGVAYDGLSFAPGGASRIPDGMDTDATTDWVRNDFDLAGIPGFTGTIIIGEAYNTPGAANQSFTVATLNFVHDIQGSGSSITGTGPFAVEAIVVGDYQAQTSGQLKGFFIQEEDVDADADPATSEGIFVYCNACPISVSVGDKVKVTGDASEYFGMSQLSAGSTGSVIVLSSGNVLPTAATLDLPVPGVPTGDFSAAQTYINAYFEPFEGMLVTFSTELTVSEYFELARYGQVILSAGGRPRNFTDAFSPSASAYINHLIDLESRTIILDDTDNRQNRPVDTPNTAYYHPLPGLSTSNFFRGGDTITGLTGVLHWSYGGQSGTDAWRIRPVPEAFGYSFTHANPRSSAPVVTGTLKVASFNVLNYFLTIDTSNVCGPTADQDCRGADSLQERDRQRTKLLAALSAIDADVFGLMELENTPGVEPLADIVAGLPGYNYIDTGLIGTDTIRVGIIYKTATVQPVGNFAILNSSVDPNFIDTRNRPALAQSFEQIATGERFTVVVNHLKSKGDSGLSTDPACLLAVPTNPDCDLKDGQGYWNDTRKKAAQALADWLATDPTGSGDPDNLIIGDLNSYALEDPITTLGAAGYTNLVNAFGGAGSYGYVFDGQLGYLDHALANSTLLPQVAGVAEWHINADEIPLFDYNDDVRTADEASYEEESDVLPLYEANEFRTSDHDPVLIGLNLDATPPVITVPDDILVSPTGPAGAVVNYIVTATDVVDPNPTVSCTPPSGSVFPIGVTTVNCSATDASGNTAYASFTITVGGTAYTLRVRSNGENDGTLRESTELSGLSNWAEPAGQMIAIGDDYLRRQYIGILDFDTSALPDGAVITNAKLQVKVMFLSPGVYESLGNLMAEITKPYFGTLPSLELMDFRSRSLANAGSFIKALDINQWIGLKIRAASLFAINRTGQTQFRVHFALDDNNDNIKTQIGFLSGDYVVLADRPLLIITYYLP